MLFALPKPDLLSEKVGSRFGKWISLPRVVKRLACMYGNLEILFTFCSFCVSLTRPFRSFGLFGGPKST